MTKSQETQTKQTERKIAGGCHCQAIRFKAVVPADAVILRCNCSICAMTGFNHLIVKHSDFELLSGHDGLHEYRFNSRQARHLFCRICGIKPFYQPRSHPDSWSINSHCIDGFNPTDWPFDDFDGLNWQTAQLNLQTNAKETNND